MNEKIKFVRIRGRIVPIKVGNNKSRKLSKEKKLSLQSVSALALGTGVSIASGRIATKKLKQAKFGQQQAFGFINEAGGVIPKNIQRKSNLIKIKRSKQFSSAGQIFGGALLSQAVQRGLRSQGIEIDSPIVDIGAEIGSQGASFLIAKESREFLNQKKKFSIKIPSSIIKLTKDLGTRFIKKQLRFKF